MSSKLRSFKDVSYVECETTTKGGTFSCWIHHGTGKSKWRGKEFAAQDIQTSRMLTGVTVWHYPNHQGYCFEEFDGSSLACIEMRQLKE